MSGKEVSRREEVIAKLEEYSDMALMGLASAIFETAKDGIEEIHSIHPDKDGNRDVFIFKAEDHELVIMELYSRVETLRYEVGNRRNEAIG